MLTREQNELLCRVEGGAPMGGIMRRHWLPVCLSEEVAESLLLLFREGTGMTRGEIESEVDALFGGGGKATQGHRGLAKVLEDRTEFEVVADIPPDEVEAAFLGAFRQGIESQRFLGGESIGELLDRTLPAFERILARADWTTLLMVLHGGVNRALLARAMTGTRGFFGRLEQLPACINIIDVGADPDDLVVRAVNLAPTPLVTSFACCCAVLMMRGSTWTSSLPPAIARIWMLQTVSNKYMLRNASATVAPKVSRP